MADKKRLRNYGMWASLISQVGLLVEGIFIALGLMVPEEAINGWMLVANIILGILSTLGIISNPTKPDSKGYNL